MRRHCSRLSAKGTVQLTLRWVYSTFDAALREQCSWLSAEEAVQLTPRLGGSAADFALRRQCSWLRCSRRGTGRRAGEKCRQRWEMGRQRPLLARHVRRIYAAFAYASTYRLINAAFAYASTYQQTIKFHRQSFGKAVYQQKYSSFIQHFSTGSNLSSGMNIVYEMDSVSSTNKYLLFVLPYLAFVHIVCM